MKLTNGKGNCNRNSNICNAIYRKYQKWSPRFMLYNLNPACTTKFLIKFTGMYKDDKQDFLPDYLKESKLKPPCLQLCILREVLVKNSQIIL